MLNEKHNWKPTLNREGIAKQTYENTTANLNNETEYNGKWKDKLNTPAEEI